MTGSMATGKMAILAGHSKVSSHGPIKRRKKQAFNEGGTPPERDVYKGVDWSLTNSEIGRLIGRCPGNVKAYRDSHRLPDPAPKK